jgi:rubrerythrin
MSIRFNANEVFLMAERMERNAAVFYRRAAELNPSEHNKQFLQKLAAMEDGHWEIFSAMRVGLADAAKEATAYDPMDEALLYLETMADTTKAEGSPEKKAELTGKETMEQILHIAIGLEGKAILFYMGIKDLVPAKLGKDQIDTIIREERGHVVILSKELKQLKK